MRFRDLRPALFVIVALLLLHFVLDSPPTSAEAVGHQRGHTASLSAAARITLTESLGVFDEFRGRTVILLDSNAAFWKFVINALCTLRSVDPELLERTVVFAHDAATRDVFLRLGLRVYYPEATVRLVQALTNDFWRCYDKAERAGMQEIMMVREFTYTLLLERNVSVIRHDADVCYFRNPLELEREPYDFVSFHTIENSGMGHTPFATRGGGSAWDAMIQWHGYWRSSPAAIAFLRDFAHAYLWKSFENCRDPKMFGLVQHRMHLFMKERGLIMDAAADAHNCRDGLIQRYNFSLRTCAFKYTVRGPFRYCTVDPAVHYLAHISGGSFESKIERMREHYRCWRVRARNQTLAHARDVGELCDAAP